MLDAFEQRLETIEVRTRRAVGDFLRCLALLERTHMAQLVDVVIRHIACHTQIRQKCLIVLGVPLLRSSKGGCLLQQSMRVHRQQQRVRLRQCPQTV